MSISPESEKKIVRVLTFVCFILIIAITVFLYQENKKYEKQVLVLLEAQNNLRLENASTTEAMMLERELASSTIHDLANRLSLTSEELNDIERDLRREKNRNEEFEEQIRDIAGTVGVLDKLSKTDEELLQKYSRAYFLNENFIPMKLSQIDSKYIMPGKKDQYFHGDAIKYLEDMLDDAADDGHDLRIISAFRSFDEQQELKGQYLQVYGSGSNAFSADQGFSEHQLGTTIDVADLATGGAYTSFAGTEAYTWLVENAHRYGFILSYPAGNQFYIYEPWHWRFVGRDLASDLHEDNKSFYDLEQRELDKYLVKIFD